MTIIDILTYVGVIALGALSAVLGGLITVTLNKDARQELRGKTLQARMRHLLF